MELLQPTKGRPPKYPWDEWMDGAIHEIYQGVDFDIDQMVMAQQLRSRAYKHGYSMAIERLESTGLRFQFKPGSESPSDGSDE